MPLYKMLFFIYLIVLVKFSTTKGSLMSLYMSGFVENKKVADLKNKEHTIQNSRSRNCFFSPVHCYLQKNKPERSIYFRRLSSKRKQPKSFEEFMGSIH
uniref:Secreted protein n=1 Tax=Strongyloides papillosus TaxID=174720 RepID=A0A0N5BCF4_STREA